MAIAAGTVWKFNASATAGNVNGGGFNSTNVAAGTDKTTTGNYTFADLASSNGTTNPAVVTSSGHTFDSTDVGNIIHINSGTNWTAGFYEIVSVSGGAATLDRACGSSASLTSGTYHVGGELSMQSATDQATWNTFVAGNKVWIKNGTYTLTGTLNVNTAAGTATSYITVEGYNTSTGDQPKGSTRPTITGGVTIWGNNFSFACIIFLSSGASNTFTPGTRGFFVYCKFIATTTTAGNAAVLGSNYCTYLHCEFISYRGPGLKVSNAVSVINCYFHDSDVGINITDGAGNYSHSITGCIIESCVTAAISFTGANDTSAIIANNTLYGSEAKTGSGIKTIANGAANRILGNIIYGFTKGIDCNDSAQAGQATTMWINYNNYFNNTADVSNVTKGPSEIALNPGFLSVAQVTGTAGSLSGSVITDNSANFTNVVDNQDFVYLISGTGATAGQYLITSHTTTTITLNSAPGGSGSNITYQVTTGRNFAVGSNMANVGPLGAFPGALTTGYQDIGAAQVQYTDAAASNVKSGSTYIYANATKTGTYVAASGGSYASCS